MIAALSSSLLQEERPPSSRAANRITFKSFMLIDFGCLCKRMTQMYRHALSAENGIEYLTEFLSASKKMNSLIKMGVSK